jgi:O-antigen/teichoic acid export membrane protein
MAACIARHVADERMDAESRREIYETGSSIAYASTAVILLILYSLLYFTRLVRNPVAVTYLIAMAWLAIPSVVIFGCAQGYLQGAGRVRALAFSFFSRGILMLVITAGLAWVLGLRGWGIGRIASEAAAAAVIVSFARPFRVSRIRTEWIRPFAKYGAYAAITQGVTPLMLTIDVVLLDRIIGYPEVIGQYGIATLMLATMLLLSDAYIQANYAKMAARSFDGAATWSRFRKDALMVGLLALPIAAAAWPAATLIPVVFGEAYEYSATIFRWLIPAFFIQCIGAIAGQYVTILALMRANLGIALVAVLVNLVVNALMIPRYGTAGAAAALTAAFAIRAALSILVIGRARNRAAGAADGGVD